MTKLLIASILIALSAASIPQATAADESKPNDKKEAVARAVPFRGKIAAVDKEAKTFKVGDRTFQLTADSRVTKAGKPATLEDATTGEDIGGAYREGADKRLNVVSLRIGPRVDAPAKQDDKK